MPPPVDYTLFVDSTAVFGLELNSWWDIWSGDARGDNGVAQ